MQNAMMSLLLAISNGLGLKSMGYCFQLLELHTYNNNKSFHNSAIYSTYIVLYFPSCNFMENIALFPLCSSHAKYFIYV